MSSSSSEMPSKLPLVVPAETSAAIPDAVSGETSLLPLEVRVKIATTFRAAFKPLSEEEEETIKPQISARSSYNKDILVVHGNSNIAISGEILHSLSPGHGLHAEVINLYITLLKEREIREPGNHLKCHFFNTFFYNKLVNARGDYSYDAVRRWTSPKSIGYHLKDCEKIFVPICMSIHWSLVVINLKDMKFQYVDSLDSLNGSTYLDHTTTVAIYFRDEVKDKNGFRIDLNGWTHEFVQCRPVQTNVWDSGMYMLKYIDFYSRGMNLCFGQGHIPYFRLRTAKEILQLKAE